MPDICSIVMVLQKYGAIQDNFLAWAGLNGGILVIIIWKQTEEKTTFIAKFLYTET